MILINFLGRETIPGLEESQAIGSRIPGNDLDSASAETLHSAIGKTQLVKTSATNIGDARPEIKGTDPRPMDCGKTHRTRFGRRIDFAVRKIEAFQSTRSLPDRVDLGMARRILAPKNRIVSHGENTAFSDDASSEGPALPSPHTAKTRSDGQSHFVAGALHRFPASAPATHPEAQAQAKL